MKNYRYKDFVIFIRPTAHARYGDPNWRADRSTPTGWGYRIDQMPGKVGIARDDDHNSPEEAKAAAEKYIDEKLVAIANES
ncbi:MAG TPA: hypothetical protein V6D29_13725 [Leptolyngbyaceae cyanobacterium]